jgi:hypothetical protein
MRLRHKPAWSLTYSLSALAPVAMPARVTPSPVSARQTGASHARMVVTMANGTKMD